MMDRRLAVTVLALVLVMAGSAALASRPVEEEPVAPLQETVSGIERSRQSRPEPTVESQPEFAFMLREHEGRIGVFAYDNPAEPMEVLDTLVKYLPDYDRGQMMQGIPVKDYQQLEALIEDYVS